MEEFFASYVVLISENFPHILHDVLVTGNHQDRKKTQKCGYPYPHNNKSFGWYSTFLDVQAPDFFTFCVSLFLQITCLISDQCKWTATVPP